MSLVAWGTHVVGWRDGEIQNIGPLLVMRTIDPVGEPPTSRTQLAGERRRQPPSAPSHETRTAARGRRSLASVSGDVRRFPTHQVSLGEPEMSTSKSSTRADAVLSLAHQMASPARKPVGVQTLSGFAGSVPFRVPVCEVSNLHLTSSGRLATKGPRNGVLVAPSCMVLPIQYFGPWSQTSSSSGV